MPKLTAFQGLVDIKKNGRIIVNNSVLEDIDTFSDEEIKYILTHFKQYISPILTSSYIPTTSMMEVIRRVAPEFKVRFKTEKAGGSKIVPISPEEFFEGEKIFDKILVGVNPEWTESQKYRYLYTQTGAMLSYDLNTITYAEHSSLHEQYSRNIFTAISKNWGICASFAAIYDYLCYKCNLESTILSEEDHDYVLITDSEEKEYLTDPTFDSARIKFGLRTENYAISKEEFKKNSHNLEESEVDEYDFSYLSKEELEELDKSTGYLDNFGGNYTDDILGNLANNLEGQTITEKAINFINRIKKVKTIGRPTDMDYVQIINWILSKSKDREFAERINVSSFVYENTKELPRRVLFKILEQSGNENENTNKKEKYRYFEFDYKTKMFDEIDEKTIVGKLEREFSL